MSSAPALASPRRAVGGRQSARWVGRTVDAHRSTRTRRSASRSTCSTSTSRRSRRAPRPPSRRSGACRRPRPGRAARTGGGAAATAAADGPRRAVDPDRADRPGRAVRRVGGLPARRGASGCGAGWRPGSADDRRTGTRDGDRVRRPARAAPAGPGPRLHDRRPPGVRAGTSAPRRRRVALARADRAARRARPRAGRVPGRPAGRSAGDGVRGRPVRFGRQRRPRGRPRVPARDARRQAGRRRGRDRRVRQAGAGRAAAVRRSTEIDRIASVPVKSATDIGAALRLATALFPDDAQKRIVLLSDGNDTTGGGQAEAALAASQGVVIETRRIGPGSHRRGARRAADDAVDREPRRVDRGRRRHPLDASRSRRPSGCSPTARWSRRSPSSCEAGGTTVTFDVTPTEAGFHTFRVVVEAARDTFSQNDRADSNTIVKGAPRTLVLAGDDKVAAELVAALKSQRQTVDSIVPEALPTDFASLAGYDSVVMVDVPRLRLNDRQLAALQVYVRDLGKGLVMIGGPGELRRRRLPEDPDRGGPAGRHGRARSAEGAGRRAGRGDRPVGLDGRLPLQLVQSRRQPDRDRRACARSTSARRRSCAPPRP